jgi:hypothetical protein
VTPLGTLANHWSIGTALISAPLYLLAHLLTVLSGGATDGFTGLYGITLAFTNVALAALTLLLVGRALRETTEGETSPGFAIACAVAGTPFLFYIYRQPLSSHIPSTLAVSALIYLLITDRRDDVTAFLAGLSLGFAVATRIQHIVLIPAAGYFLLRTRRSLRYDTFFSIGAIVGFLPQAIAWTIVYGQPLGPLRSGVGTWAPQNGFWATMFSSYHGLLSWSPLIALAVVGWLLQLRTTRSAIAELFVVTFVLEWLASGTFDCCFWSGMSFGNRRMSDLFLIYVIGLAWSVIRFGNVARAIALLSVAWSLALFFAAASGELDLNRDLLPSELLSAIASTPWLTLPATLVAQSPLARAAGASLLALLLAATMFALALRLCRSWRVMAMTLGAYVFVSSIALAMTYRTTRDRAAAELQRFKIDVALSRSAGPLIDLLGLKRHVLRHYERRGDEKRAAVIRGEIETLEKNGVLQRTRGKL